MSALVDNAPADMRAGPGVFNVPYCAQCFKITTSYDNNRCSNCDLPVDLPRRYLACGHVLCYACTET